MTVRHTCQQLMTPKRRPVGHLLAICPACTLICAWEMFFDLWADWKAQPQRQKVPLKGCNHPLATLKGDFHLAHGMHD